MSTTDTRTAAPAGSRGRVPHHLVFRLVCLLEATVYLVVFGTWRAWLSPWVTVPDGADHGWQRTPELHRWADSAAAALFLGLTAALVVLALRPARRGGLLAWVVAVTVVMCSASAISSLVQEHAGLGGALLGGATTLLVLAGPLVLAAPDRAALLRLGRPERAEDGRDGRARRFTGLTVTVLVAWAGVAVVAVAARLAGHTFESRLEDDTIGFVLLATAGALGCWLVLRRREGWRPLAWVVAGMTLYAVLGGLWLALAG